MCFLVNVNLEIEQEFLSLLKYWKVLCPCVDMQFGYKTFPNLKKDPSLFVLDLADEEYAS